MKRATKEVIECEEGDLTPLIAILTDVDRRDGWVNLTPGVPADIDLDEDRSLVSFLAGSSRVEAPLATWMPAQRGSGKPGTLGVLHRRGRLHRAGLAGLASIPSSWRCRQDHARRGLLFEVVSTTPSELAETMVAVVEELTTLPTTGRYLAELFTRS
jgi:hypothetical protein